MFTGSKVENLHDIECQIMREVRGVAILSPNKMRIFSPLFARREWLLYQTKFTGKESRRLCQQVGPNLQHRYFPRPAAGLMQLSVDLDVPLTPVISQMSYSQPKFVF